MMLPDLEKYRGYMGEFDMTDEERDEVTLALWSIMTHFIDHAFDERPTIRPNKAARTGT